MVLRQRAYNIDDLWQLVHQEDNDDKHYELIDGEIFEMSPPGQLHGHLAIRLGRFLDEYAEVHNLGIVTTETGYHPPDDRGTLLAPDVALTRIERLTQPIFNKWVPMMPDLAVEIVSPSNSLKQVRRKAAIYLQHGTQLVWIVLPERKGIEVCRLQQDGSTKSDFIGRDGTLSAAPVLPGFTLEISRLFT